MKTQNVNPKLDEAIQYLDALKKAIKNKDKKEILSLYDEHYNSDIEWDDFEVVPEQYGIELDELTDDGNEILGI